MRIHQIVAGLGAVGLATALTSCGGASPKTAATTTTIQINPVADRATAQKINLTGAELPGWQESPNPTEAANAAFSTKMSACLGGPPEDKIDVVDVSSPTFNKGQTQISSDVTMVRSHAEALADDNSVKSPKLRACAQKVAKPALAAALPSGTTVQKLAASTFKPPEHVPTAVGLNFTITISATDQSGVTVSVPISIEEIGFVVGRAEVTLSIIQPSHALSTSADSQLVNLLYSRASRYAG